MNESQVKIAAKLYEIRDTVKHLFGSAYPEIMEKLAAQITDEVNRGGGSELSAATRIATQIGGVGALTILAAYVEMTEPSVAPDAAKGAGR